MKYLAKIKEMLYNKFKKKFERKNVMLEWYDDALQKFNERSLAMKIKEYEADSSPVLDDEKIHFIRCDGRSFKNFCYTFQKPFDSILRNAMRRTMVALCEEIQGSFLGYTQSDEITIVFKKMNNESELPFKGRKNKIATSVASSCAILFNKFFEDEIGRAKIIKMTEIMQEEENDIFSIKHDVKELNMIASGIYAHYTNRLMRATFDARVFSMPKEECSTGIIWRILDCHKNAVQMIARCHFPLKELHKKKTYEIKEMLNAKGNYLKEEDIRNLYGTICYKKEMTLYRCTERECMRKKFVCEEPYYKILDGYEIRKGETILRVV